MASAPSTSAPSSQIASLETPFPQANGLIQAAKLAQQLDRPILLDYYADSCVGKAYVAEDTDSKDKLLMKSNDEFTSVIQKLYKVGEDYLVLTENSIYMINGKIPKTRLSFRTLMGGM
jgi:hypothetical protein